MGGKLLDVILRLITLGSVIVGAAAIYYTIRTHSRELNAQIFLTYSDRLNSIRRSMRSDLLSTRVTIPDGDRISEIPPGAIEALHLIFELYALREEGYIQAGIWRVWMRDIDRFLAAPIIRQGHEQIKQEFACHTQFIDWIAERQNALTGQTFPKL